ncbi:hypothetical protein AOG28_17075 [Cobetia sp. UCD-24C]|nr:hypothetical protein AOG28_17075 [Cobetia sp. UCD-24C]
MLKKRLVPLPRHVSFFIKLIESTPVPETAFDLELFTVAVEGNGIGSVSLQLDSISTCFGSLFDNTHGRFEPAIMVGGKFSDNIGRLIRRDTATSDLDRGDCHVTSCSLLQLPFATKEPEANDIVISISIKVMVS